jgi:hypothetical protein
MINIIRETESRRGYGRTLALVEAVIRFEGILIVHSEDFANYLRKKYPNARIESLASVTKNPDILSCCVPILLDHHLVGKIEEKMYKRIVILQMKIKELEASK